MKKYLHGITNSRIGIALCFALGLSFSSFSQAQPTTEEVGSAVFNSEAILVLPESEPLLGVYIAPVDNLTQQTPQEIEEAFGHESSNLVTFTYDADNHQAVIYIHKDRISTPASQTVAWWNNYLLEASMNYLTQP